jgi:hypothetical protein
MLWYIHRYASLATERIVRLIPCLIIDGPTAGCYDYSHPGLKRVHEVAEEGLGLHPQLTGELKKGFQVMRARLVNIQAVLELGKGILNGVEVWGGRRVIELLQMVFLVSCLCHIGLVRWCIIAESSATVEPGRKTLRAKDVSRRPRVMGRCHAVNPLAPIAWSGGPTACKCWYFFQWAMGVPADN